MELMVVCAIAAVIMAMAIPMFKPIMQRYDADSAAQLIAQELSLARAMAIATGGPILVQFDPEANTITVAPGTGSVRGPFLLPGKMMFMNAHPPVDTPDTLGGELLGTGLNTGITFLDNGTAATDASGVTLCSGTFFLRHVDGDVATTRAVTLLSGTGKARIWKFNSETNSWN
jgi:Tfp pilus assembly protein FimT